MKKIIPKLRVPKIGNIFNPAAEMGEALLSGDSYRLAQSKARLATA